MDQDASDGTASPTNRAVRTTRRKDADAEMAKMAKFAAPTFASPATVFPDGPPPADVRTR